MSAFHRSILTLYMLFFRQGFRKASNSCDSVEYISILMSVPELVFLDEIDCNDLFEEDTDRNRIMIWQIG